MQIQNEKRIDSVGAEMTDYERGFAECREMAEMVCERLIACISDPRITHDYSRVDGCRNGLIHAVEEIRSLQPSESLPRPKIVCLCGSTRFKVAFDEANYQETMAGHIILSVGFYMHASGNRHGEGVGATPEQKIALDVLHKRKIDLADEVLVLNIGGYIGESTRSEIEYAEKHGKPVRYLEPPAEHKERP